MQRIRILVVDDEPLVRNFCREALKELPGAEIHIEEDGRRALERIKAEAFDLLISDVRMPEMDGVELLRRAREICPDLPVVMITGYPTIETTVQCLRFGAVDYVVKPLMVDDLLSTAGRVLEHERLKRENSFLSRQRMGGSSDVQILGSSKAMIRLQASISRFAEADVDLLILGETGTGKELAARQYHALGSRSLQRFVPVDCGAISAGLMESEFFGHERGSFTGAAGRRMGLAEYADGGTLFLDEIGELPLELQSKLLRLLQERRFRRVGGTEEISVDLRVVSATNRDIKAEIEAGRFREDLYFRLRAAEVRLPPLRDRAEDIPELVRHIVDEHYTGSSGVPPGVPEDVLSAFRDYAWPGNVRELINVIRVMLAMTEKDEISLEVLPEEILAATRVRQSDGGGGYYQERAHLMDEFSKDYFERMLREYGGDVSASARKANIPRQTFYRLLKRFDIDVASFRS